MDRIKELLKEKVPTYGRKIQKHLIEGACDELGDQTYLTICMEEIAELLELVGENKLGKLDYYHTAEEITDVIISSEIIMVICNIRNKDISKAHKFKKNVEMTAVTNLSRAQQNISKYIRWHNAGFDKIEQAVELMNDTVASLIDFYKIKKKDIAKIRNLKFQRLEERIMMGTVH